MQQFDHELTELKSMLIRMGGYAEAAVKRAMQALVERDDALVRHADEDDRVLDRLEIEVDEFSLRLLAKAPLATDLRLITVAMKISRDLERVGDEATTICHRVLVLNQEPQLKPYIDIPHMANLGLEMLKEGLASFLNQNSMQARAVVPKDKLVDALNKQLHRELAGFMVERPSTLTRCLSLMVISKSLERIADHAKNIAEEVVFLHEGRDIRHHQDEAKR